MASTSRKPTSDASWRAVMALAWLVVVAGCGGSAGSGGPALASNDVGDVSYSFGSDTAGGGVTPTGDGGATEVVGADGQDGALADAADDTGAGADGTGGPDTEGPDTAAPDTAAPDTAAPDTAEPDTGAPDAGGDGAVEDVQPSDSAQGCGDGACGGGENCQSCPADCGACPAACGDGACNGSEDCKLCPADCGACPKSCGNGKCEPAGGEHCKSCPADCGVCPMTCGNGKCDGAAGESCQVCPSDCGACPAYCGDGACNGSETCKDCPLDCGVCPGGCGDGKCDGSETCSNCAADCGQCPGSCSPLTQDGCPPAQQCYPVSSGAPLCGTPGNKTKGDTCTSTTDCLKGLLCAGKICKLICDSSGSNGALGCPSGLCNAINWADGKPVGYNLGICFEQTNCNLVTDIGCQANQSCDFVKDGKACFATGAKTAGQGCTSLDECVKGTMCIGNPAMCLQKCNTVQKNCPSGKTCLQVTIDEKKTPAPDNLGVCN